MFQKLPKKQPQTKLSPYKKWLQFTSQHGRNQWAEELVFLWVESVAFSVQAAYQPSNKS